MGRKTVKKTSPPTRFSVELFDQICEEIASSDKGLAEILKSDDMPSRLSFYRWMEGDESGELRNKYVRAKDIQADYMAEQILAISDDGTNDYMERMGEAGEVSTVIDKEHIQRSRLRVDARKWLASKLKPKTYGDKLEVEQTSFNVTLSDEDADL